MTHYILRSRNFIKLIFLVFCLLCFLLAGTAWSGPDSFLEPLRIGPGHAPDIVVDAENERIHLIYINGDTVYYCEGNIQGVFASPEVIATENAPGRYWYPRIALDGNGVPHVVFSILKPNKFYGIHAYYSNRIGGRWKAPLTVFSVDEEEEEFVNFPHLIMEDDGNTVYLGVKNKKPPIYGEVARVDNASTNPKVAVKREVEFGGITMLLLDGELQVFGGEKGLWHLFEFDKQTMKPTGNVIDMAEGVSTEQIRAYQDALGEVHFVGATWRAGNKTKGFYNSLSRVKEGKELVRYLTTNGHHSGNGRIVRDARKPERVYNFHYSGATGDKHGVYYSHDCEYNNQVHFLRLENGEVEKEHQRITHRDEGHGSSFRLQVAAEPHPQGGAFVVYPECSNEGQVLQITIVGECSDLDPLRK